MPGHLSASLPRLHLSQNYLCGDYYIPIIRSFPSPDPTYPRILCMVFTVPGTWNTKTRAVYNTWGSRCYKTLYFYSKGKQNPTNLPKNCTVALDTPEGRGGHLTRKIYTAMAWAIKRYRGKVDWYLKVNILPSHSLQLLNSLTILNYYLHVCFSTHLHSSKWRHV